MLHHRHEIEALRGWAVVLVVAAHAGVSGFAGGFIGVDVFFVISGYLITQLLLKELRSTGKIDLLAFYARRVRRLLPALVFLITGVAVLMYWLPIPIDQEPQRKAAIASMLWLANIHFSLMDMDYFGPQASDNLFLHLWSLGVEEQFYLIWPFLLLVIHRLFRSPSPAIAVILVASLLAGMLAFVLWPVHAYYQMPFRLWQLAAGGVLAASPWFGQSSVLSRHKTAQAALGTGLLVLACVLLSSEGLPYPGPLALLPTLAAMLLINAGGEHGLVRLISNPLSRSLGAISYSLYLWHWPLLLMAKALAPGSAIMTLAAVLLAILMAWISLRLIEHPLRKLQIKTPSLWLISGVSLTAFSIFSLQSLWKPSLADRSPEVSAEIYRLITKPRLYSIEGCDDFYHSDRVVECVLVDGQLGATTLVLAGDSVAAQWTPALEAISERHGWRLIVFTKGSCPMLDIGFHYDLIKRRYTECETWRDSVLRRIATISPDILILGSTTYNNIISIDQWQPGLTSLLEKHPNLAPQIRYLAPTPILSFDPTACLKREAKLVEGQLTVESCEVPANAIYRHDITQALRNASSNTTNFLVIETVDILCPDGKCKALSRGIPVWRDNLHLNAAAATNFAPDLEQALAFEH